MDINMASVLTPDVLYSMESEIRSMAMSRFLVGHSSARSEEEQKVISTMADALSISVDAYGSSVGINIEILDSAQLKAFKEKYSTLMDQYEQEINAFVMPFASDIIESYLALNEVQERLKEYIAPQIEEELATMFGGDT